MIRVAIVDDDAAVFEQLKSYFDRFCGSFPEYEFSLTHFDRASSFLSDYENFDILFMDIEMPEINGIKAAAKLRELGSKIPLVFVTNMVQYVIKGYSVSAVDYVLKPILYPRFSAIIKRLIRILDEKGAQEIIVKTSGGMKKVNLSDVFYIEVIDHLLVYHTAGGNIEMWGSLKDAETRLPKSFVRCNHAFIVNLENVASVDKDEIIVSGCDAKIFISRSKKKDFMTKLNVYLGRK